jgi:hypothetical protein
VADRADRQDAPVDGYEGRVEEVRRAREQAVSDAVVEGAEAAEAICVNVPWPRLLRPEEVVEGMLMRCPKLETSIVTRGNVYVVLWKVHKPQYEKYPGANWQVALQRYNRPPYKWPKIVGIGHLEPAFGAAFQAHPYREMHV